MTRYGSGYDRYCDHQWARDDQYSKVCVKCKQRKEIEQ